jgi:hypothetical protein
MPRWRIATVHRTGNERLTITEAHPYHKPVGKIDHKGAGNYIEGYDPQCPLCREQHTAELEE